MLLPWAQPMLLLTNLEITEKKKLCLTAAKVYLMRGEDRGIFQV